MENDAEIEIDLRRYITVLLRYWRWIVGTAVVVALAALIWSFLQPPSYVAVALVAITQPQYTLNFDPRFGNVANNTQNAQVFKAYPELAKSDDLLQSVYSSLEPRPKSIENLRDLSTALTAQAGADPSLVRLSVQAQSPADAARIANIWAASFITRANAIYGQDPNQVQSFETQAANAEKDLQVDEQALIDNQAHDRSTILQNQLNSIKQKQVDYLTDQRSATYLLQDIAGLREQLSKQSATGPSGLADRLTALFLQIKAYKAQADIPIQLQFSNTDAVVAATVGEQIAFLDGLSRSLKAQLADMDARLKDLEPQTLTLQQQIQQMSAEKDRITRTRDVARQTALTLAQKVEESRIAAQATKGNVQLASSAVAPEAPVSSRSLANTALGGIAGLILSISAVFIVEWMRNSRAGRQQVREVGAAGNQV